jgi:hypothetical protein
MDGTVVSIDNPFFLNCHRQTGYQANWLLDQRAYGQLFGVRVHCALP